MGNESGISLVTLIASMVILFVLAGVSISISYSTITSVRDNKLQTELGMVKQAVAEQYMKASAVNQTGVSTEQETIVYWVGTRIDNFEDISLPMRKHVKSNEQFFDKVESYAPVNQEDFYYRLDPTALYKIGISDAEDTYIVNYATSEVYNETRKVNSNFELLYIPGTNKDTTAENQVDNTFNDWNE